MGIGPYCRLGCMSSLRAEEFLTERGIQLEFINLRQDAGSMKEMLRLGAMSRSDCAWR